MKFSSKGFSLIEVLVAMVIMSFLTVIVSTSIRSSLSNKQKIETRMKYQSMLYDAIRIVLMDVERAFHYQDVFFEIEELAIKQLENEKSKKNQNGQAPPPNQARRPPPKLTQFLGAENNMHFTSLNHFRTKYNAQESNQMEVGFYIESCKRRNGKGNTKCLWRRNSLIIDDEVDKDGSKVVVAEDVVTFKLAYRSNREEDEWVKQWRSDNKGRADHRNKFPHQVRVELELHNKDDKKAKPFSQQSVINVQFPNNEPLLAPEQNQGNPNGGQNP